MPDSSLRRTIYIFKSTSIDTCQAHMVKIAWNICWIADMRTSRQLVCWLITLDDACCMRASTLCINVYEYLNTIVLFYIQFIANILFQWRWKWKQKSTGIELIIGQKNLIVISFFLLDFHYAMTHESCDFFLHLK